MARVPHRTARRRLRLAVAGAVVLTALTAATAGASVPPVQPQAPEPTRLGTSPRPSTGTGPRTGPGPLNPFPGFVLDRAATPASSPPTPTWSWSRSTSPPSTSLAR
jgi:hypothetical protein